MDKHDLVVVILLLLFLGSFGFSIMIMNKSSGVETETPEYSSELEKLSAKVIELEEEKQKLEEEKSFLEQQKLAVKDQLNYELDRKKEFGADQDSPFDHVKDSQVKVLNNKVEVNVKDVEWWTIQDTNSMDPLIDIGTTALSVKPKSEDSIHLGDVAFYHSEIVDAPIVHRVIDISFDELGWYSKFKGDNLKDPDPENVRYKQILGVLIGIIY